MPPSEPSSPANPPATSPVGLPARLQADLTTARKARDSTTVAVLRTALSAIANAEAPPVESLPAALTDGPLLEYPRLDLSPTDIDDVLRGEIADRQDTAARYAAAGRNDAAAAMHAEVEILERYLS